MNYVEAMAAIFWARWHSGAGMPRELLRNNRWAAEEDLRTALLEFHNRLPLPIRMELEDPDQEPSGVAAEHPIPVFVEIDLMPNPYAGRHFFYEAIVANVAANDKIGFFEVLIHHEFFVLAVLLYAVSCYAIKYPDSDIPLTEYDIHNLCDRMNERVHGVPSEPDSVEMMTIAWQMADHTEEGRWLKHCIHNHVPLPPTFVEMHRLQLEG